MGPGAAEQFNIILTLFLVVPKSFKLDYDSQKIHNDDVSFFAEDDHFNCN